MKTTLQKRLLAAMAAASLVPVLGAPALGTNSPNPYRPPERAGDWWINMPYGSGFLIGFSSVAATIQFDDGIQQTFQLSHDTYEQLLTMEPGDYVAFDVTHNRLENPREAIEPE